MRYEVLPREMCGILRGRPREERRGEEKDSEQLGLRIGRYIQVSWNFPKHILGRPKNPADEMQIN